MSGFYFGNGNGYSYGVRRPGGKIIEFATDTEAQEYFEPEEETDEEY